MKVKSLCSFNRSSGRDGAVKTAIKLKQHPTLCPLTRQNRPLFEVPISLKRSTPIHQLSTSWAADYPIYVKRQKNDMADAEAICEAVARANMRFVPTKTPVR